MGQNVGDCVVKDHVKVANDHQPAGFHAELHSLDRSSVQVAAAGKQTEVPSLPPITIVNEQNSNQSAIRPVDQGGAYSTYENLDANTVKPLVNPQNNNENAIRPTGAGTEASSGNSIYSSFEALDMDVRNVNAPETNAHALRPAIDSSSPNSIYSAFEALDLDVHNVNAPETNANALRPAIDSSSPNSIYSAFEALDLDVHNVNAPETNANALRPAIDSSSPNSIYSAFEALDLDIRQPVPQPDENQNQDTLLEKIRRISAAQSSNCKVPQ
jgi:hypothetical protein